MQSLIAAVIIYNPDSRVIGNILSYSDNVEKVIVIDNSESANTLFYNQLRDLPGVITIKNDTNIGIAEALNIAAKKAIELNFTWLLTMDQDSSFNKKELLNYLNCFENTKTSSVGILGINYIDKPTYGQSEDICRVENVETVITSGSIMNLISFTKINGFNTDLFIDGVDDDYCYRLIQNGFSVIQFPSICMNHSLGNDIQVRNWHLGPQVKRNIHSPIRIYYMIRNYLYLIKKYKCDFPYIEKKYKKELGVRIKNNILYNKKRISVFKYLIKGYYHFYIKKMGKLE